MGKTRWCGFEDRLADQCKKYRIVRPGDPWAAKIHKVDPPSRVVGRKPNLKVIYLASDFVDFIGSYAVAGSDTGRMITFEAKTTTDPRLMVGDRGLKPKQLDLLREWREAGALTGLIWEYAQEPRWFTVSQIDEILKERKSIPFEIGTVVPQNPWPDFLAVAIATEIEEQA